VTTDRTRPAPEAAASPSARPPSPTGLDRRRFLVVGGASASFAALLAACASENREIPVSGSIAQPATLTQPPVNNAVYLRTSSSVVHNAVDSYGTLLGLHVLSTADTALVDYIRQQQAQQAQLLEEATKVAGGTPYTKANPNVSENIVKPALEAIDRGRNNPEDVLRYINAFETLIGSTLQGYVPLVTEPPPRELMMRIAAVDNRHAAVIVSRIKGFTVLAPSGQESTGGATTTAPATTSTTVAGGAAAPLPAQPLPVSQVPGAYASLAAVEVVLGGKDFTWETPGPNSYIYEVQPTTTG
jgi:hypothetical protein